MGGRLTWHLWVDWDGDGVFEADEGGALFGLTLHRGRREVIRRDGRGFEPPNIGRGTLMLLDRTGRYDPWNTSSPIYPNFTANKRFKLEVSNGVSTWPVVYGRLQRIQREQRGGYPTVRVDIEDGWAMLEEPVYVTMQRNIYAGDAMGLVLDAAGWPAALRDLSDGVDVKQAWWSGGESGLEALHALAEAEYGLLHMRGDGAVRFRDRHDTLPVVRTVTGSDIQRGIRLPLPWEAVRTVASVRAYSVHDVSGTLQEWTLSVPIAGSSTEEIFVEATEVYIETVSSLTWTATENPDGTGADMSGDISITAAVLSPTRLKLAVQNTATTTAYLQTVRADGTGVTLSFIERRAENATGQSLYGDRTLEIRNRWLQDAYVAKDIADHCAHWYGEPAPERAMLEVRLKSTPEVQFGVDVGDVVTIDLPADGIHQDYILARVEHHWRERTGQVVETKWHLVPKFAFADIYWFFPTRIGETSRFGF